MHIQIIGSCAYGHQLATSHLVVRESELLLAEALAICGSCQANYRFIVIEEHGPRTEAKVKEELKQD